MLPAAALTAVFWDAGAICIVLQAIWLALLIASLRAVVAAVSPWIRRLAGQQGVPFAPLLAYAIHIVFSFQAAGVS